jgi:hypothetical protein
VQQPYSVSKLIPGSGHAVLATDGPGKLTAAITFGPYGGFHGHYDKLSFVYFGYGKELAVDPGRAASQAYRLPIHQEWYKASTGHNAVLVDGKPQKEATGQLLAFAATGSYAAVSADAGPAYDNVAQHRFLLLSPSYLLVVDELIATDNKEHTFDWLYHNKGNNVTCSLPDAKTTLGDVPPGYAYLNGVKAFKTAKEDPFKLIFTDTLVSTNLTALGQEGDVVFTATGPLGSVVDRVPVVIIRRKGKTVYFIAAIEPVSGQMQPDLRGISIIPGSMLSIRVVRAEGEDLISFSGESLSEFTVSNKQGVSGQSIVLSSGKK